MGLAEQTVRQATVSILSILGIGQRAAWVFWRKDQFRVPRGVEVLERIGTREARRVLEAMARGMPESRLTGEAKAALARLEKWKTSQ